MTIAMCGLVLGILLGVLLVINDLRQQIPSQKDEDDLMNKLNRMALERNNTHEK